jgi:hypothetical protein
VTLLEEGEKKGNRPSLIIDYMLGRNTWKKAV